MTTPEARARATIDELLTAAGWQVQDRAQLNLAAGRGVAVREFALKTGYADYLLFVDRKAIGAIEAKAVGDLARGLLDALDPDRQLAAAQASIGTPDPSEAQIAQAAEQLIEAAVTPFHNPVLRNTLVGIQQRNEQTLDQVSVDRVLEARYSADATAKARATVESFQQFLLDHRDEIAALQILLNQPQSRQRLTFQQLKELAQRIAQPPLSLTTEALWRAYAQLEQGQVRGATAKRVLADMIALVRHAVQLDPQLAPYPEQVRARYEHWLAQQEANGRQFTADQRWWLDQIAEHIGVSLSIAPDDFAYGAFFNRGGAIAAVRAFPTEWPALLDELNAELVA